MKRRTRTKERENQADSKAAAHMRMGCPFCGEPAHVKACKNGDYYWRCGCAARGFFPDRHFRALDQAKKILLTS